MLDDSMGRDEYGDQKHGRFRKIKAAVRKSRSDICGCRDAEEAGGYKDKG
jgi:hypothetical protein